MDGRKASLTNSLQFQLSAWLSGAVILLALGAGGYSFWSSFHEANELQDDQLRQMAALIHRHDVQLNEGANDPQDKTLEPDLRVVVQVLGESSAQKTPGHAALLALPHDLPDGLQTVQVAHESELALHRLNLARPGHTQLQRVPPAPRYLIQSRAAATSSGVIVCPPLCQCTITSAPECRSSSASASVPAGVAIGS